MRGYPGTLWLSTAVALLGSVQFGFHLGVMNTCLTEVAADLGFSASRAGAVVVSALLVGAALGSLFAGRLADRVGPKKATVLNTLPLLAGTALSASATQLWTMLLGRAIAGVGAGAASVYVPRYLSEISPDAIRGALGTLNQVCVNVGILAALAMGVPYEHGVHSVVLAGRVVAWWRVMLGAALLPGLLQAAGMAACPETPIWLLWQGAHLKATKSFHLLHGRHFRPEDHAGLQLPGEAGEGPSGEDEVEEAALLPGRSGAGGAPAAADEGLGVGALLAPRYRRVMVLAAGLPLFQQLSGINSVVFYSSEVFQKAGLASPILASIAVGGVNVGMTVVAVLLMDRAGRKPLLTTSFAGMAACLGVMAAFMLLPTPAGLAGGVSFASILAYVSFFALGCGPIPWVYLSEILPQEIKGNAQAACTSLNWLANLAVGLSFPAMLHGLGIAGSYLVFCAANVAAALFSARLMVETKQQSLEHIRAVLVGGGGGPARQETDP